MVGENNLDGKIALVVGAGQSWLEPIGISLLEAGANVIIVSEGKKEMPLLSDLAVKLNRQVKIVDSVLKDHQRVSKIIEETILDRGRVDILVNSMNIRFAKPLVEVTKNEWQKMIATNLSTLFSTCQAVGKQMLRQKAGKVINVTSCLGERGLANCTAYCAAAGGVIQFTRALALEWAKSGITVNAVTFGWIFEPSEKQDERIAKYIPMRRYGRPEEIAPLVVYLASSASDWITGQVYSVDGGVMGHS